MCKSRFASSLGSVSRPLGSGHLRALLSTPPLGQSPPAGAGRTPPGPSSLCSWPTCTLSLWWGRLPPQSRPRRGSGRAAPSALGGAGCGEWRGRGPGGALLPARGQVLPGLPGAQAAPGSGGGSKESPLGRRPPLPGAAWSGRLGLGTAFRWPWGPMGPGAALRGSHLRPSRAVPYFGAHGVDPAGLPGGWSTTGLGVLCFRVSVLRPGMGPGSL